MWRRHAFFLTNNALCTAANYLYKYCLVEFYISFWADHLCLTILIMGQLTTNIGYLFLLESFTRLKTSHFLVSYPDSDPGPSYNHHCSLNNLALCCLPGLTLWFWCETKTNNLALVDLILYCLGVRLVFNQLPMLYNSFVSSWEILEVYIYLAD